MISSGSFPKAMGGADCDDHCTAFSPKRHPDANMKTHKTVGDHKRGAKHPQFHTKGQPPSQMNPDHGPKR